MNDDSDESPINNENDNDWENAKKSFHYIERNKHKIKLSVHSEHIVACDCQPSDLEENEKGCSNETCSNAQTCIECGENCRLGDRCGNRRFKNKEYVKCIVKNSEKKDYCLWAVSEIPEGKFLMEFVGEILTTKEKATRESEYMMHLFSGFFIDAGKFGNKSRFINHSCDPNAKLEKWWVEGFPRIGVFSIKPIKPNEEITIDYGHSKSDK